MKKEIPFSCKKAGPVDAMDGVYLFKHERIIGYVYQVIASTGLGWEHVSVTIRDEKKKGKFVERTPTWSEMCRIKDIFWDKDEVVVQYHPAESDYVSNHHFCLHLWRPTEQVLPTPDALMVGIPTTQTLEP